jgi:hypothetical protein
LGIKQGLMVGPPGFEPESIEPKSTSLDQASRRPHVCWWNSISPAPIKTLSKPKPKPLHETAVDGLCYCFLGAFFSNRFLVLACRNLQGSFEAVAILTKRFLGNFG